MVRIIIGGKRGIRVDWKIITNFSALLFITFAVTAIEVKRVISAVLLSCNEEMSSEQKILVGKLETNR